MNTNKIDTMIKEYKSLYSNEWSFSTNTTKSIALIEKKGLILKKEISNFLTKHSILSDPSIFSVWGLIEIYESQKQLGKI